MLNLNRGVSPAASTSKRVFVQIASLGHRAFTKLDVQGVCVGKSRSLTWLEPTIKERIRERLVWKAKRHGQSDPPFLVYFTNGGYDRQLEPVSTGCLRLVRATHPELRPGPHAFGSRGSSGADSRNHCTKNLHGLRGTGEYGVRRSRPGSGVGKYQRASGEVVAYGDSSASTSTSRRMLPLRPPLAARPVLALILIRGPAFCRAWSLRSTIARKCSARSKRCWPH